MIEYRGYKITPADGGAWMCGFNYEFTHQDYDGPGDHRHGVSKSVEGAKSQIDDIEDDQ